MPTKKSTVGIWEVIHKSGTLKSVNDYPSRNAITFNNYHIIPYVKNKMTLGDLSFLDIGCGSGANAIYFGQYGYDISAIDCSTEAVRKTLNNSKLVGLDINCIITDFKDLPFDDNSFDTILSDGVLYYGDESTFKVAVKQAYRVLKKNGIIRVYTKSNHDFMAIESNKVSSNTYMVKTGYEKGLTVFCAPLELIDTIFSVFNDVKIGIEEFNYIGTSDLKSFWVITAQK